MPLEFPNLTSITTIHIVDQQSDVCRELMMIVSWSDKMLKNGIIDMLTTYKSLYISKTVRWSQVPSTMA